MELVVEASKYEIRPETASALFRPTRVLCSDSSIR